MTSNAIAAMRLQEEKRHNQATEGEAEKSRKTGLIGDILGATLRGLGTGIMGNIVSGVRSSRRIQDVVQKNKNTKKGKGK